MHPVVRIFCGGAFAAELGPTGFAEPVTFTPDHGAGFGEAGSAFWLVADVLFFPPDECGQGAKCVVSPIFADAAVGTPLFVTASHSTVTFPGPAYPPVPSPSTDE